METRVSKWQENSCNYPATWFGISIKQSTHCVFRRPQNALIRQNSFVFRAMISDRRTQFSEHYWTVTNPCSKLWTNRNFCLLCCSSMLLRIIRNAWPGRKMLLCWFPDSKSWLNRPFLRWFNVARFRPCWNTYFLWSQSNWALRV